jgi:hypothetical protein
MKNTNQQFDSDTLDAEIALLQVKQTKAVTELKEQLFYTFEKLDSNHLIKSIFNNLQDSAELKNESIALAAGYISQGLFVGKSEDKVKITLGKVIQNAVTAIAAKYFAPYEDKV